MTQKIDEILAREILLVPVIILLVGLGLFFDQLSFLIFPLMWIYILFRMNSVSGWKELSEKFPCQTQFEGEKWRFCSASVGLIYYQGTLTFSANEHCLFINIQFPFKFFGTKALLIPLEKIRGEERASVFMNRVHLNIEGVENLEIKIYKNLANRIESASQGKWTYTRT